MFGLFTFVYILHSITNG